MNTHEISKSRLALRNAGTPAELHWLRANFITRLANEIRALKEQKEAIRADFRRKLERWRTEEVPEHTPVCAMPSDIRESRFYRITGVFALACEAALAAWIFYRLGVPWWIGSATALGLTGTLHGAFLHLFDDPDHPRRTIHRIKSLASIPACIGFLVALAVGMLARYVSGPLAVTLLPYLSLALWLGTLSLLVLAASLFTIAHILRWSRYHAETYRTTEAEEQANTAFLEELRWEEGKHQIPLALQAPEFLPRRTDGGIVQKQGIGFLAVVVLALSFGAACSTPTTLADAPAEREDAATLHIYMDWSGSPTRPALEEAWDRVQAQLPDIAERQRIDRLTISAFDDDGWSPRPLADLALPSLAVPSASTPTITEWDSFANIREAIQEAEEKERTARQREAAGEYRANLVEALAPLASTSVLPDRVYQTRHSDIAGLLKRLSQTRDSRPLYAIVVTDLADTRSKTLPHIPAPEGGVRVVVLHVPAQPKDAALAFGKTLTAAEQFESSAAELRQAIPWATLAPYFEGNLASRFNGAIQPTVSPLQ